MAANKDRNANKHVGMAMTSTVTGANISEMQMWRLIWKNAIRSYRAQIYTLEINFALLTFVYCVSFLGSLLTFDHSIWKGHKQWINQ